MGKHRALSREVTCYFRLYLEIGWTSVNPIKTLNCDVKTTVVYTQRTL